MTFKTAWLVAMLSVSIAGAARAQRYGAAAEPYAITKDEWPDEVLRRPLTLAQGLAQLTLPVTLNLSNGSEGQPVYVPAILAFGVTDAFTVAINHDTGICLSGTSNGCPKVYNDIGLQGFLSMSPRGAFQSALVVGVQAASLRDPFAAAAVVGFDSRYSTGTVALRFDPRLAIGFAERDALVSSRPVPVALDFHGAPIVAGNRESLFLPVALQLQATRNIALTVGSGIAVQLDPLVGSASDTLSVPLGISAAFTTSRVDLGASFGFANLRGSGAASGTDVRTGQVFVSLRI